VRESTREREKRRQETERKSARMRVYSWVSVLQRGCENFLYMYTYVYAYVYAYV